MSIRLFVYVSLTLWIIYVLVSITGCGTGEVIEARQPAPIPTITLPGPSGADAKPCSVSPIQKSNAFPFGASVIVCPDGTMSVVLNGSDGLNGSQGLQGETGSDGQPGPQGSPGPSGIPGTVIQPTQFCGGITGSYPSTFPEVGFCIGGNMYAVYSANDGFLTLIPPGTYTSDGINASCTFTLGNNCQVSQ